VGREFDLLEVRSSEHQGEIPTLSFVEGELCEPVNARGGGRRGKGRIVEPGYGGGEGSTNGAEIPREVLHLELAPKCAVFRWRREMKMLIKIIKKRKSANRITGLEERGAWS